MPYQELSFVPYEVTPILPRSIVVAGSVTLWVPYTDGDNPLLPSFEELVEKSEELRKQQRNASRRAMRRPGGQQSH